MSFPTPYFSLVSPIEDKVIEAESQAVLNTVTEDDFQDALEQISEALGTMRTRGRELRVGLLQTQIKAEKDWHNTAEKMNIFYSKESTQKLIFYCA
jgi:hypothetical protein